MGTRTHRPQQSVRRPSCATKSAGSGDLGGPAPTSMTLAGRERDRPIHARRLRCPGYAERQALLIEITQKIARSARPSAPRRRRRMPPRSPRKASHPALMAPRHRVPEAPQSFPKTMAASRTPNGYAQASGARRTATHSSCTCSTSACLLLHHTGAPDQGIAVACFTTRSRRPTPTPPASGRASV